MNNRACIAPDVGILLHAYELGALSAEDVERFEIHLLACRACFETVQNFAPHAENLRQDVGARQAVSPAERTEVLPLTFRRQLWHWLWPNRTWTFRPALIYLVLLILIYPAYLGWTGAGARGGFRQLQTLMLHPSRSAAAEPLSLSSGRDAVIEFVYRVALVGQKYQLLLAAEDGAVLASYPAYDGFDKYERGSILFPANLMHRGKFTLEILDAGGKPPLNRQVYGFRIE